MTRPIAAIRDFVVERPVPFSHRPFAGAEMKVTRRPMVPFTPERVAITPLREHRTEMPLTTTNSRFLQGDLLILSRRRSNGRRRQKRRSLATQE